MIKVIEVSTNDPELFVRKLVETFHADRREDKQCAAERMFGLKIGGNGKPRREKPPRRGRYVDAAMTARKDLLGIRSALLDGDEDGALKRVDWTLDQIDNWLAEN